MLPQCNKLNKYLNFSLSKGDATMTEPMPIVLVPGLLCSPRLYAGQIPALWPFGPVTVADHRRDDTMDAIARRILADAPPRFALVGLSMGGYVAFAIMRAAPERVDAARVARHRRARRPAGAIGAPQGADRDGAVRPLRGDLRSLQWPLFVHKNRQGDAALKKIIVQMAEETGPDAFVAPADAPS